MSPRISVVIPTLDRSALLRRTLTSVLAQVGVELDVIVVDEASSDGTVAMLESFNDPRITIVRHKRALGLSAARNSGLSMVRSEWVAFCDDDDIWAPEKVATQLDAIDASDQARWCACGVVYINTDLEVTRSFAPPDAGDVSAIVLAYNVIPGGGSGTIASTDLVRDVGGFDTDLKWGEDWDMWCRLSLRSPLAVVNRPMLAYLIHGQNMSRHSPRFNQDVERIGHKYSKEMLARNVVIDRALLQGVRGNIELESGRRLPAAWHFLGGAYHGAGIGALKRAALSLIAPNALVARHAKSWCEMVPNDWMVEVDGWLSAYRLDARNECALHDAASGSSIGSTDTDAPNGSKVMRDGV